MDAQTLIGLGLLVVGGLTFFYNLCRNRAAERRARIQGVFENYRELAENNTASGFEGLRRAGVVTLKNDGEIRDLATRIVEHGMWDPLTTPSGLLDKVDLKKLFDIAKNEVGNWYGADQEAFIRKHNLEPIPVGRIAPA